MARFLITGAAGFIGSALAEALVHRGHQVRAFDNLSSGRLANLAPIHAQVELIEADIRDAAAVAAACEGMDYVLHQAAVVSVTQSVADPIGSDQVNTGGTLNVLEGARRARVKRVLFAASSAGYGQDPALPKSEDMAPAPISPYGVQKVSGENYLVAFHHCYDVETVSLRYFNVYGPRQDARSPYSGVLARFISQMLAGEQPTIFGDGQQSRDFVYVDDVVGANLLAIEAPAGEVAGRVFNVASGVRVSLNEVYAVLRGVTGYSGPPAYAPERPGDIKHSLADIGRARQHLRYQPQVSLQEGLRRTVAWYREQLRSTTVR